MDACSKSSWKPQRGTAERPGLRWPLARWPQQEAPHTASVNVSVPEDSDTGDEGEEVEPVTFCWCLSFVQKPCKLDFPLYLTYSFSQILQIPSHPMRELRCYRTWETIDIVFFFLQILPTPKYCPFHMPDAYLQGQNQDFPDQYCDLSFTCGLQENITLHSSLTHILRGMCPWSGCRLRHIGHLTRDLLQCLVHEYQGDSSPNSHFVHRPLGS